MATASPPTIGGTARAIAAAVSRRSPLSRRAAPAKREEQPGRRARPHRREREQGRERQHRRAAALRVGAEPREGAERDAQDERHPPDEHVRHDARGEEPPDEAREAFLAPRDHRQRGDRDDPGDEPERPRPEQRCERPEEQRVARLVMPAVPLRVPDREALAPPQAGAVLLGRQVGGRRVHDEPRQTERQRAENRPDDARGGRPGTGGATRLHSGWDAPRRECVLHASPWNQVVMRALWPRVSAVT